MKMRKLLSVLLAIAMVLSCSGISAFAAETTNVAKIGDTEYATIDEAVKNWTKGTTLTLLSDVALSDVITLKSTEHHILNLGTYTMTAASEKNAIEIVAFGTGNSEQYAITINADATNPGGINAGKKSVIYYNYANGGITTNDRPIIKINGGVFTGATSSFGTAGIYFKGGSAARQAATVNISGGTFNCSINGQGKSKLIISGGTFNYSVGSQGDSTANRLISGGTFSSFGFMTADSNNTKFWFGTSMGNSNVGVHVDDNGYIVVGGAPISEAGETFEASSANYSGANSLLQYSSAKDNGLYYTSVEEAFADNNKTTGSVTVYVDELNMTEITYKGTIVVPEGKEITIIVEEGATPAWSVADGAVVTYTDAAGKVLEEDENGAFAPVWDGEGTETDPYLIDDIAGLMTLQKCVNAGKTYDKVYFKLEKDIDLAAGAVSVFSNGVTANWEPMGTKEKPFRGTFDGNGKTISNLVVVGEANQGFFGYATDATIENINIENATVIGTDCVGAIAGQVYASSVINNCHVSGNIQITGQTNVGGIAGKYYTKVNNSSVIGDGVDTSFVKGVYYASDLEGDNIGGIMGHGGENNNFVGNTVKNITISGTRKIGGIVGTTDRATDVSSCVVENVVLETTATVDYAADNAGSMALGGLIGHYYGDSTGGTVNDSTVKNISFVKENDVPVHAGAIVGNNRKTPDASFEGVTFGDNTVASVTGATNNYLQPAVTYVAEVNGVGHKTLEEAFKAATAGCTITLLDNITISDAWDCRYNGAKFTDPVTIDGNEYTLKITGEIKDNNWNTVFRFEEAATVRNLTIDVSEATSVQRGISAKSNIVVDNCTIIGNGTSAIRAVIFGEGAGAAVSDVTATITNSKFINWIYGVSDNQSGKDAKAVTITGSTFTNATVLVSAYETVTFTDNTMAGGYVNISSYTVDNTCNVTATGNVLDLNATKENTINVGGQIEAQKGFVLPFDGVTITNIKELIMFRDAVNAGVDYAGKTVTLTADIDLAGEDWSVNIGDDCNYTFDGIFDGNDHTIYNLNSTETAQKSDGYVCTGLFGAIGGSAQIKNLTIENATINTGDFTGNNVGVVVGFVYNGTGSIENVNVIGDININAPGIYGVGTIVGYSYYNNNFTIKNCKVAGNENSSISAISGAGGIIGYSNNDNIIGCEVSGLNITGKGLLGGIAGIALGTSNVKTASVSDVTLNATSENWKYGNAVAIGTIASEGITVSGVTYSNVNVDRLVGSAYAEKPTAVVPAVQAKVGDKYYTTLEEAFAVAKAGDTVTLTADVDLEGKEWTPIADFQGTFDGQGHTISNLVVNGAGKADQGFFGVTQNGEIKNVNFHNAKVTGRLNVGVVAGTPYTSKYTNINITGHVEVNGMSYVGGMGGKNAYADITDITIDVDDTSYVKANSVENGKAYRTYVGGVIGFMGEGSHKVKNVRSNINVIGSTCDIGGIVGIAHYGNNFENVTCSGTVTNESTDADEATETGGIAGVWNNTVGYTVTFTGCSFTGKVEAIGVAENAMVGAAYTKANDSEETSGSLVVDGVVVWPLSEEKPDGFLRAGYIMNLPNKVIDGVEYYQFGMIAAIDTLNYSEVGFECSLDNYPNTELAPLATKTVYKTYVADNGTFTAKDFGDGVNWIFGHYLWLPADPVFADTPITFNAYAKDSEGNITYRGNSLTVTKWTKVK